MSYLLDTCVLSEAMKPHPDEGVIDWLNSVNEGRLFLSVAVIAEIQQGVSKLPSSKRQRELQTWLEQDLLERFAGRVLAIDIETAMEWGRLQGEARKQGRPAGAVDSLLAASAIRNNLTLVTRNVEHFERFSVKLLNPFAP